MENRLRRRISERTSKKTEYHRRDRIKVEGGEKRVFGARVESREVVGKLIKALVFCRIHARKCFFID